MSARGLEQFETIMRKTDKLNDSLWKATTAKRITLVIPKGIKVYDTDLKKTFVGDGSTAGGVSESSKISVRKIAIDAAASGGLTATTSGGTNSITWTLGGAYLRTGDAIIVADGTGGVPSGLTTATGYYIFKPSDVGDGSSNTNTTFKVSTTRANAIAGTAISLLSSGTAGWTAVISGITANENDDVLLIDPVSAACDVFLPDANTATGFSCLIKRGSTATNAITVKELDASGNVSASGDVTIDDAAGYRVLAAASTDFVDIFADTDAGEHWFKNSQIS